RRAEEQRGVRRHRRGFSAAGELGGDAGWDICPLPAGELRAHQGTGHRAGGGDGTCRSESAAHLRPDAVPGRACGNAGAAAGHHASPGRCAMSLLNKFFGDNNKMGPRDPSLGSMLKGNDPWDLNFPLFAWSPHDHFTLRNAVESVAIFGELGAAKTTGSAAWILLKYLEIGMGGLVCCVKPGDRELIEAYAKQTGRADSLIVVSPQNRWRCNLIRYALKRPGAVGSRIEQIVSLLMTIVEAAERGERAGVGQGDKFWQRSLRQIL